MPSVTLGLCLWIQTPIFLSANESIFSICITKPNLSIFLYVSHRNLENVYAIETRWQFLEIWSKIDRVFVAGFTAIHHCFFFKLLQLKRILRFKISLPFYRGPQNFHYLSYKSPFSLLATGSVSDREMVGCCYRFYVPRYCHMVLSKFLGLQRIIEPKFSTLTLRQNQFTFFISAESKNLCWYKRSRTSN